MYTPWGVQLTDQCARLYAQLLPNNALRQTTTGISLLITHLSAGQSLADLGWNQLDAGSSVSSTVLEAACFFTEKEY